MEMGRLRIYLSLRNGELRLGGLCAFPRESGPLPCLNGYALPCAESGYCGGKYGACPSMPALDPAGSGSSLSRAVNLPAGERAVNAERSGYSIRNLNALRRAAHLIRPAILAAVCRSGRGFDAGACVQLTSFDPSRSTGRERCAAH